MEAALGAPDLGEEDRLHLHFALGKALEDRGEAEPAFGHYAEGNRLRRAQIALRSGRDQPAMSAAASPCSRRTSSPRARARAAPPPDPIFILGMPRAGSTLIEQILASHPEVEGTMELPDIPALAKRLGGARRRPKPRPIPNASPTSTPTALAALGEEYLERTRVQRKTGQALFHRQDAQQLGCMSA